MIENFQKALDFTLPHEGVYSNDKIDPGGETKYGIARKYHPEIREEDWISFGINDAKAIYRRDYWNIMRCDDLPYPLDIISFDTAVNCGCGAARKMLRNCKGNPKTMLQLRREYYVAIIAKTPKLGKFKNGWENRCKDLEAFL